MPPSRPARAETADRDADWSERLALVRSGLDEAYYRDQLGLAGAEVDDAAAHYLGAGWRAGLDPVRDFSTRFYLAAYADALGAEEDPFSHYLRVGKPAGWPATHSALNRAAVALGDAFDLIALGLDRAYYVRQFPSLKGTTISAAQHYVVYGCKRGLEPSPAFDTAFYLSRSPDVAAAGIIPFHHYLGWGRHEGRLGRPAEQGDLNGFDLDESAERVGAEFDRTFYLESYPFLEANHVDPLLHFQSFGWRQGFDPTPWFSTRFYLDRSPDVREADANPFDHYLRWGRLEGRAPSSKAIRRRRPLSPEDRIIEAEFDPAFYLATYPEVARRNADPFLHFIHFGFGQGNDPNPEFSTRFYLERSPDVAAEGGNAFLHYLQAGRAQGRMPQSPAPGEGDFERSETVRAAVADALDGAFYRRAFPERSIDDPVDDYLEEGWRLGRDPAPWFSTAEYLARYPGVSITRFNPFYHYLVWGRSQGLEPFRKPGGRRSAALRREATAVRDVSLRSAWAVKEEAPRRSGGPIVSKRLNVHWILPDVEGPGRGGHMTILRMVRWLEIFGHRCTLWINDPGASRTMNERLDLILRSYQVVSAELRLLPDQARLPPDALIIATSWDTAHRLRTIEGGAARFYFVQDLEPAFYSAGARAAAAEQTYGFDLGYICAGRWLEEQLRRRGRWARSFELAPEERNGPKVARSPAGVPKIAFYARERTERRMFELGMLALEQLAAEGVRFQAELFGMDQPLEAASFPAVNHGVLSPEMLPALFDACDVGLCLSATNYSLTPQEMMACALPVVELDGENTRAVFPEGVITLAKGTAKGVAAALRRLLTDPGKRWRQVEAASAWVGQLSWERSARAVEAALLEGSARQGAPRRVSFDRPVEEPEPLASVVIPTLNGGELFQAVLEQVLAQRTPWPFEVLVVDSESTDGTWEHLLAQGDRVKARRIRRSDFQHGRTRNEAVADARGEFVALLTQDALPADVFWLYDLVESLRRRPRAAGAFGRHLAREDASPFVRRDIDAAFEQFAPYPLEVSRFTDPARWRAKDEAFRRMLHFFSDNNACLRKSVWRRKPYPEVDFGEDQLWAAQVVAEGYSKVYVPSARVFHSHDYDEAERYERARVEAAFLWEAFGYDPTPADFDARLARMDVGDEIWGVRNGVSPELIEQKRRLNASELRGATAGVLEARSRRARA